MLTQTPRTDAEERLIYSEDNEGIGCDYAERVVDASFARELEREIAELREALQKRTRKSKQQGARKTEGTRIR